MDIKEYLFKNRIKQKHFLEEVQSNGMFMLRLKNKISSPSLLLSIKIIEFSKGKITLLDLLSISDKKELADWFKERKSQKTKDHELRKEKTPKEEFQFNEELEDYIKILLKVKSEE